MGQTILAGLAFYHAFDDEILILTVLEQFSFKEHAYQAGCLRGGSPVLVTALQVLVHLELGRGNPGVGKTQGLDIAVGIPEAFLRVPVPEETEKDVTGVVVAVLEALQE